MIALGKSKVLDETLTEIFRNEECILTGFDFEGDVQMFVDYLPEMKFIRYIENFVDA